jgi:hypothetical protein
MITNNNHKGNELPLSESSEGDINEDIHFKMFEELSTSVPEGHFETHRELLK